MKNISSRVCGILAFLMLATSSLFAQPAAPPPPPPPPDIKELPAALKVWADWATWNDEHQNCPTPYNDAKQHLCFWPSRLGLNIQPQSGRFELSVQVFSETWVPLPGGSESWPVGVTVNGTVVPVVEHEGHPSVKLAPGSYKIEGGYRWNGYPQNLKLPQQIGLISLTLSGQLVDTPAWDADGFLWFRREAVPEPEEMTDKDSLQVKAYALLEDGIPLWLRTEVELIASGKSREEVIGAVVPAGWKIASVESSIPVSVDEAGSLKAQVRAGRWSVYIHAFRIDNPKEFRYSEGTQPAIAEEFVAYRAQPEFRTLEIAGAQPVDASLTTFPEQWRGFPVYRWDTRTSLLLEERMRGMGEEKPAGLSIVRHWWLDEAGRQFTFRDQIIGTRQQIWRLDAAPGQALGGVRSDGEWQLITRSPRTGLPGVEIRTRNIDLNATGRIDRTGELFATGWSTDADILNVTLDLPPGWRLFALFGADWVNGDWLTAWTLLDLFLLLVFTLAVYRLWGVGPAVLAFVAFGLSYHETGSPRFLWLLLLIPLALLRVVHGGWAQRILMAAKWVFVAVLAVALIPFVARQVQQALYPQLEDVISYPARSFGRSLERAVPAAASKAMAPQSAEQVQAKLENIVIPRLEFREATLKDAIEFLRKESVAQDPSGQGVNIVVRADLPATNWAETRPGTVPQIPGLEVIPGSVPISPVPPVSPGEARITVSLSNIPLGEALRYVTGLANLKYKVEPNGVSIVSQGTPTESLITKEIKVPPGFLAGIPEVADATRGGATLAIRANAKDFLAAHGMTFPPGSSAIYLPSEGKLIVRNTQENLDLMDAITEAASIAPEQAAKLEYDPAARIQTGPAVPDWSWRTVSFGWNGPVGATQQVHPVLIPAAVERLLSILRVILLLALAAVLLNVHRFGRPFFRTSGKAVTAILIALLWSAGDASAQTSIPDQATLEKLRERLLKQSDAYPHAADIPSATLALNDRRLTIDAEIHTAVETAVPLPGRLPAWSPVSVFVDDQPAAALRREDGYLWVVLSQGVHRVRVEGMLANNTEWQWSFLLKPRHVTVQAPGWTVTGVDPNGVPEQQVFFALPQKQQQQQETPAETAYSRQDLQAIVSINRELNLGLTWIAHNTVTRLSSQGKAIALRIPLLPGETVLSSDTVVKDGFVEVRLGAQQTFYNWESRLEPANTLTLATRPEDIWVEKWQLVVSPVWNVAFSGLPPIFEAENERLVPVWRPWPGEQVTLSISRPEALAGAAVTVSSGTHAISLGKRQRTSTLNLSVLTSIGGDFLVDLPADAEITSLSVGSKTLPVRKDGNKVIVPLRAGEESVALAWKINAPLGIGARVEEVRLPVESANIRTTIEVPEDRWVLWANGPMRGPAVRFWVILICSLIAAVVLGRLASSPLRTFEWMLLVIGLTQVPLFAALVVVGWLFFLAWRGDESFQRLRTWNYNVLQVVLLVLTIVAIGILFTAVGEGLLGRPEMFISGNGSTRTDLRWYQSLSGTLLPTPAVLSVSIWWYRFLMLAWALWLAAALLRWLRMGWQNFSRGGFIRMKRKETAPV